MVSTGRIHTTLFGPNYNLGYPGTLKKKDNLLMLRKVRSKVYRWLAQDSFLHLNREIIELNDIGELKRIFNWQINPILDDLSLYEYRYIEDINQRRLRDAESLATVVRNTNPAVCLDIGTAEGHSAALMAINAPESRIFTINIPPEEINSKAAGKLTTMSLERDRIGSYYRSRNLANITQILMNTAQWKPDVGIIDIAYIDGCHDTEFVYNDTRKILHNTKVGSFILWHDFNPGLASRYEWIYSVCMGVEKLYSDKLLRGHIYHVRDSWIGIYELQ